MAPATLHAQPDAYGLSASASSYKWLTVSQTTGLGTLTNFVINSGTDRYNKQVAKRSQMVRRDDQGNILFFAVDGNVYDRDGYLMAANNLAPSSYQDLVDPGIIDFISVPVPGSCSRFYLLSAVASPDPLTPAKVSCSILDLEAPSNYHTGRSGALMKYYTTAFDAQFPDMEADPIGTQERTGLLLNHINDDKSTSPIIRVVKSGTAANAHSWLFFILTDQVLVYKITATGIFGVQPIAGRWDVPMNDLASPGTTKQYVNDADVFRDGGQITLAVTNAQGLYSSLPNFTDHGNLITMRFNNTTGAYITGSVAVRDLFPEPIGGAPTPPATGIGRLVGCAFGTTANTLWVTGQEYVGSSWVPRIGTVNVSTGAYADYASSVPSATNYVHSRLYRNIAPGGGSEAIYFPTATGVGALAGIHSPPTTLAFTANAIPAPAPVLSISGSSVFMPRFLNEGVHGENFLTHYASSACCAFRATVGAYSGHTVATSNTFAAPWQPGSNPFGGGFTVTFTQDLVVPAGKRLYIKDMTLRFTSNAKLVVEKGGYVHTRNTRLTAIDCANARWPGVLVLGSYSAAQTTNPYPADHGRMELTSTSVIENANVGVLLRDAFLAVFGGGILNASNSTFLNCREGVRMLPYQNYQVGNPSVLLDNRTNFTTTTFTVNASYPAPYDFKNHVWLNYVSGIRFTECHFKNERADALFSGMGSLQLGHGINSLDAGFKVLSGCAVPPQQGQPCAPANVIRSSFIGLDHGIHALVGTTTRAFEVDKATFTNNICGVYTIGTVGYKVTNNNFTLGNRNVTLNNPEENPAWLGHHRGVYSSTSYGFVVDDNNFQRQGTRPTEGIVIGDSRDHNDIVFRNTASGMDAAYVGERECCDISQKPLVGLQFRCNQNNGNGYNIWNRVIPTGIPANDSKQTIRTVQGQLDFPAGNTFDRAAGGIPESDLHYNWNLNVTNYIGHAPGSIYDPLDIDATYFPKTIVATAPSKVCLQKVPPLNPEPPEGLMAGGLHSIIEQEREAAAALRYVYDNLIDGGSTDALVQEIADAWPAEVWELRASLLAKSPYLSTEVLVEAVSRNILPQAVVLEICTANPEATQQDGFVKWLEETNALPAYMLGLVEESWQTKTFRFALENELAGRYANMDQTVNALLQLYHADTLYEHVDSLRHAWQQLRSPAARYAEAMALVQLNDFEGATALFEGMGSEHRLKEDQEAERGRMLTFIGFLQGVQASGRTVAELTEAEQDQLENTVAVTNDRPGTWARNILCFHYGRCVPPPTGWDSGDPKSNHPQPPAVKTEQATALQAYPNPATTWVTFAYELDATPTDTWITVLDAAGRQVARLSVASKQGQLAWDPRGLASGAYTVELRRGGLLLESTKLVIQ